MPPGTLLVHDPCKQELAHFLSSLILSCFIHMRISNFSIYACITDQLLPDEIENYLHIQTVRHYCKLEIEDLIFGVTLNMYLLLSVESEVTHDYILLKDSLEQIEYVVSIIKLDGAKNNF
jgi:hypothetical protein